MPSLSKTVALTRPPERSSSLLQRLRAAGAKVKVAPLIRIAPPSSFQALDRALKSSLGFDAAVFTSANAVEAFFARAAALRLARPVRPPKLFAVGPETARALRRHGWTGAKVPGRRRAEGLLALLAPLALGRVLIPRAEKARELLPRQLRRRGAKVTVAACYRTLPDPAGLRAMRRIVDEGADVVAFASGSAVESLFRGLGAARARALFKSAAAASIGPVTSAALRRRGVEPAIEALDAESAALARAIAAFLRRSRRRRK